MDMYFGNNLYSVCILTVAYIEKKDTNNSQVRLSNREIPKEECKFRKSLLTTII